MKLGIYRLHEPANETELSEIENEYGAHVHTVSVYRAWNNCSIEDDLEWLDRLKRIPRSIMLTWEPWRIPPDTDRPFDQPDFSLVNIINGRYDDYITSFAGELANFSREISLRTMHEMNGNWYPWCGSVNSNSPELFVSAWKHVRGLFNSAAPAGIKWVWCPYAHSYPAVDENDIENYFPGDEFLDFVAVDGYNWGTSMEWSSWQGFEDIFADAYKKLAAISTRPFIIGELSCAESGGSKADWIRDAMKTLRTGYTAIDTIVWFDIRKECDWRINSSPEALRAFRESAEIFSGNSS